MIRHILLAFVLIALPVAGFTAVEFAIGPSQASAAGLGDLSAFKTIIADVQALATKGDLTGAAKRVTDYESAWDAAETAIRPLNQTEWNNIDSASDDALKALRRATPSSDEVKKTLEVLIATLDDPTKAPQ